MVRNFRRSPQPHLTRAPRPALALPRPGRVFTFVTPRPPDRRAVLWAAAAHWRKKLDAPPTTEPLPFESGPPPNRYQSLQWADWGDYREATMSGRSRLVSLSGTSADATTSSYISTTNSSRYA